MALALRQTQLEPGRMRAGFEFSASAQVSIRTLRHYDEVGLLPSMRVEVDSGYPLRKSAASTEVYPHLQIRLVTGSKREVKLIQVVLTHASSALFCSRQVVQSP